MNDILLKEIFLYGNLDIAFSYSDIKKIDVTKLNFEEAYFDISFCWRCYKNFKILFDVRQYDIMSNIDNYIYLLNLYRDYILLSEKSFQIKERYIGQEKHHLIISVYSLLSKLYKKIKNYDNTKISQVFSKNFCNYLIYIKGQRIKIQNGCNIEKKCWSPKWAFIYNNEKIRLENIDCYLDTYFTNLDFNCKGESEIMALTERINFLKDKAKNYFDIYISLRLYEITKKIYHGYPYRTIFIEYPSIIDLDPNIYKPELYKYGKFKSKVAWLLTIIPLEISSYLLGYPVISCGCPSIQNIKTDLERIEKKGWEFHLNHVRDRNKKYIDTISFGVNISNGLEKNSYLDTIYEKIIDYNIDDTILFFNNGCAHLFTSPEFHILCKKQVNPYDNITKIPMIDKMIYNMGVKSDFKNKLKKKKIDVFLEYSMEKNIELILEKINNPVKKEKKYKLDGYVSRSISNNLFVSNR